MPETEVVWTLGASQDFLEAQSGQSDEVIFVHAVDSALELLKSFPGMGAKVSSLQTAIWYGCRPVLPASGP
ncbi:MAG: hypothetical protein P1V20_30580 [Verrucomicrobiales bacterium]|nr:hypothetical protein [Verrucomicrobiales bacterium]